LEVSTDEEQRAFCGYILKSQRPKLSRSTIIVYSHVIIFDCKGRMFHSYKYTIVSVLSGFAFSTIIMDQIALLLKKLRVVLRHVNLIQADNGAVVASDKLLNRGESLFKWNVIHLRK
jgi:hypothetical protein